MCLLGAQGVGKTSLARRRAESVFDDSFRSTMSVAIFKSTVTIDDLQLDMMLWDPGGVETRGQYNRSFISGASGLVFVVDATKPRTLDHLLEAQTRERGFIGSRPSILIVNKMDLTSDFALTKPQLDAAGRLNWRIAQASAKSGHNVSQAFEHLGKMMVDTRKASPWGST